MTRTIFACISSWPKIWFYFEIHVELGEGLPGSNISSLSFNARSSGRLKNRLADLFWLRFDQINLFGSVLMISGPWFMAHSLGWAIDRIDSNSEKTLSISDNRVRWLPDVRGPIRKAENMESPLPNSLVQKLVLFLQELYKKSLHEIWSDMSIFSTYL